MNRTHFRYTEVHEWGNTRFTLTYFEPQHDECKFLLMKVVEQAVRDFINLEFSTIPIEKVYYESATGFLFDTDYRIDYGGHEMSFSDVLDCLDMEAIWFREQVSKLKERKRKLKQ